MNRRKYIKISGIIFSASLAGCINQQNNNSNENQQQNQQNTTSNQNQSVITPRLSVQNQIINGSEININKINIDKTGWVIIHQENNETQTENKIYGYKKLQPGNYTDISLDLTETIERNQTVYASLYYIDTIDNPRNITVSDEPITINGDKLRRSIDISISQENQDNNQENQEKTVILEDTSFNPARIEIDPGDTIIWINEDTQSYGHTVKSAKFHETATNWSFESEVLGTKDQVKYTFTEPGIYQYYCTIHGQNEMCGTVLVGDVSLNQTLPCKK